MKGGGVELLQIRTNYFTVRISMHKKRNAFTRAEESIIHEPRPVPAAPRFLGAVVLALQSQCYRTQHLHGAGSLIPEVYE